MKRIFYYLTGNKASQVSWQKNYNYIDEVLPTGLQVRADGTLIDGISNHETLKKKISTSKIIPVVQNYQMSNSVTRQLLTEKNNCDLLTENIITYLSASNYTGINLDLEGVRSGVKDNYLYLINRLGHHFKKIGYKLGVSVPAKTENHVDTGWAGAYDYNQLGERVDKVIIMAYDYHWAGGTPGPISPISWVYDVVDYVMMEIPLSKIIIGLPCYGYDWVISDEDSRARGLSFSQIQGLLQKFNKISEWDQESATPYFRYHDKDGQHEVWYENKFSLKAKIKMLKKFQIKEVAFWRLGLEDPGIWRMVK